MTKDYKVGYGKPPKATQFTKGKSGNPKGKPKHSSNEIFCHPKHDLLKELQTLMVIMEGGIELKVTKQRVLMKTLINNAIKGDKKAYDTLSKVLALEAPPIIDIRAMRKEIERELAAKQFLKEYAKEIDQFLHDDSLFEVDESTPADGVGTLDSKANLKKNEN